MLDRYRGSAEREEARRLISESRQASFSGLQGAALPFFLAALFEPADGPCLVVTATQEEAEELREELEAFSGAPAYFFPPWESLFLADSEPDADIFHERLRVLKELADPSRPGRLFVAAPIQAVIQPVASRAELLSARLSIACGPSTPRDRLAGQLAGLGFRPVPLVLKRGEFSVRGDIVDFFPFDSASPLRLEFFGDALESIREFQPESQRSLGGPEIRARQVFVPSKKSMFQACFRGGEPLLIDYLLERSWIVLAEPPAVEERLHKIFHNLLGGGPGRTAAQAFLLRLGERRRIRAQEIALPADAPGLELQFGSVERFHSADLEITMARLSEALLLGKAVTLYCDSPAERQRLEEIIADHKLKLGERLELLTGPVRRGFESLAIGEILLSTRELFNRHIVRRARKVSPPSKAIQSFFELEEGDLVVHLAHGIGRYLGVRPMEKDGIQQEFLEIEYRDEVKVYVPASKLDLVQKYIGTGAHVPALDRVGGSGWNRRKELVEKAVQDFASELLEIQALRQEKPGVAYPPDAEWQRQFEASFPFEDTPDQTEATLAVKADLESPRPADRLICGDVGYGKTEVAMRAAFKAACAGKQAAILVPTTVLAQQHCRTFRERMASFPFRVEQISRFCTPREQQEILAATAAGAIDILIGTHRLLSDDVQFKDLGLVIIDEEQRFGVGHKEKLKRMRALVDMLTLTATPIPRTLHMALLGIRDISSLSTPPEGRSPITTEIIEFDRSRVREAILRELNREGQVYFVHNRIEDIGLIRRELQQTVPEARTEFAHGQMPEHQLEDIMVRFLERGIDVLLTTTIIESGIDIANVNTIFINECDRYGLSELHQLRGRVGRSRHKAYCYLILPEHRRLNPDARKRVQAVKEFSQLGAGFQIAMRDLEIRGAGNILGAEQSGHIGIVGYDLYCRMLEKAVKRLRGEIPDQAVEVEIDLNLEAYIPEELIPLESARLEIYRKVSRAQELDEVEEIARELEDRYGEAPPAARRLLDVQRLRVLGARNGLRSVRQDSESIILVSSERLRPLLEACPLRAVIASPAEIHLVVNDPRSRRQPVPLSDELVFRAMLEWLKSGRFPSLQRLAHEIKRASAAGAYPAAEASRRLP
ncbi:MAG: transcription-repair coupling factor [Planctomycetes bacterium]|nr:transcription-repair coupling factor [Planctomycetota bacterium]